MPAFFACMATALCFMAFLQYAIWKRTPQKNFFAVKIKHIKFEGK